MEPQRTTDAGSSGKESRRVVLGLGRKETFGDILGYVRALILDLFGPHREPLPCNFFILVFLKQFLQIEPEKTYSIL
jgi:hypothetical protein